MESATPIRTGRRLVGIIAGLCLVAVGCSSDSSDDSAGPTSLAGQTVTDGTEGGPSEAPDDSGSLDCEGIDVDQLAATIAQHASGATVSAEPDPIYLPGSAGIAAACEFSVDLTEYADEDSARLSMLLYEDSTWPPNDDGDAEVVPGVGDDARSMFGYVFFTARGRVLSVAVPGVLEVELDDADLHQLYADLADVAIAHLT